MLVLTRVVELLGTGTRKCGGNEQDTAQGIDGALAHAQGELELRIADSLVSIPINGQVRQRVQTPSAGTAPSCDSAV